MKRLTLHSPAKLNLFLRVLNKRPDGYHNLETLFERINLADEIEFSANAQGRLRIACDHPHVPVGPKNLIYKVAVLLKNTYNIKAGADIKICKRIPVAAGLAGGSSNAATALLGLSRLWNLQLSQKELLAHARTLGSDIPFFLYDCSWALGTERGDRIKPVSLTTKLWHILIVPRIKMYSREVFTHLNLKLTKTRENVNILIRSLRKNDLTAVGTLLSNDLETSILSICPRLGNLRKKLQSFPLRGVAFSGSGPAVYGLASSQREAEDLRKILSTQYAQVYAVRTL